MSTKPSSISSERSAETRQRILDAAAREFAANGLAGARTETIAAAAGVNKALLYYYFASKDALYQAALEDIAARVRDTTMAMLLKEGSPGERILRSALGHFDRVLSQQVFQSLMQQEMIRLHRGESAVFPVIVKRVFEPMMILYRAMVREGIASGELIDTDWAQIHLSSLGANVLYFLSAPVWRIVFGEDPMTKEALVTRRKAIVDFLGQALFRDRQHGADLAARVYADSPMPEIDFEEPPGGGPLTAKLLADAPRPEIWNDDESKRRTK
jgi:TetR/AcrR family transcriptional regulator